MQTGPMKNQSMRGWLLMTGVLELFCAGLFSWLIYLLSQRPNNPVGFFTVLGLATLNIVLVQGGVYWLLKGMGLLERLSPRLLWRLFLVLYLLTGVVLLLFPLALLRALLSGTISPRTGDLWLGLGWYLFGVGEFVHYFLFKINMRGSELRQVLRERGPLPGRFLREAQRAYRRAR